jgi:hypothetical protein
VTSLKMLLCLRADEKMHHAMPRVRASLIPAALLLLLTESTNACTGFLLPTTAARNGDVCHYSRAAPPPRRGDDAPRPHPSAATADADADAAGWRERGTAGRDVESIAGSTCRSITRPG